MVQVSRQQTLDWLLRWNVLYISQETYLVTIEIIHCLLSKVYVIENTSDFGQSTGGKSW